MSLTAALDTATTGLKATSLLVQTTGNNVANAMTPGYTRREVQLDADILNGMSGGVRVTGVVRSTDNAASASRRAVQSDAEAISTRAAATARIASELGEPGETGALANRVAQLEAALVAAGNEPGAQAYLDNGVARAIDVANEIRRIADTVEVVREQADTAIAHAVETINFALEEIERINTQISYRQGKFAEVAALEDARQAQVDIVADYVPVRIIKREQGQIALYTPDGGALIDGPASELEFTPKSTITLDMTFSSGALSGVTIKDDIFTPSTAIGRLGGGSLAALFEVRDEIGVSFGSEMDAIARDLIERFQDPAVDGTLSTTDAGLFTDNGAAFDPINTSGIAQRISVNAAVDPSAGGQSWRLRDGLNAATPGEAGDNTILKAMQDAMRDGRTAPPGLTISGTRGAASFVSELTALRSTEAAFNEERSTYMAAQLATLREAESSRTGVDTDAEMAFLLEIEQAYAANARVLSVIDRLMQRLLEI